MANLPAEPAWPDVRQLESSELARGGLNGNMNEQAKALLARTEFLKETTATLDDVSAIANGEKGSFRTKALAIAASTSLPANCTIRVTTDEVEENNGLWDWDGNTLEKSKYDPVTQTKKYTDQSINSFLKASTVNLYNPSLSISGSRVSGTGNISAVAGAKRTGYIPVIGGQRYMVRFDGSPTNDLFAATFTSETINTNGNFIRFPAASKIVFIDVPADAKYLVCTLQHATADAERTNFMVALSSVEIPYEPFNEEKKLAENFLPKSVLKEGAFENHLYGYEKEFSSKNLFDHNKLLNNYYLLSSTGGLNSSSGWTCSGFIPVTPGKSYTLSGIRSRQGISFFSTNTITANAALLYDNTTELPLTVIAPEGANYAVIALESSTVKGWSNIQFEEGSIATEYFPYGENGRKIKAEFIDGLQELLPQQSSKAKLVLTSGTGKIQTGQIELGVKIFNPVTYTGNPVFNFNNDKFNNTQIRLNGDDVAPTRMMGATIGANHGYARSNLTVTAHGKTVADVGSVWTDGTNEWVIVQINSVNLIGITCRNKQLAYSTSLLPTLTHVSGATNTASFKPTAAVGVQWYPMLKNHAVSLLVDGKKVTEQTGEWGFNNSIKVIESYDLMEKNDIAAWLIANGGKEVASYNAESALNVNHIHNFNADGTDVVSCNFFTYKALSTAQDLMFIQSARLLPGVDGSIKYYVPRSIAFTHESQNFDFSKPFVIDALNITTRIDFTADRTESNKALPDRLIMLNNTIGYAVGYLPILDASENIRNMLTSKGIQISQSEAKVYPYLVDGLTTLAAGISYSCVAYRKYFKRPSEPKRTAEYDIPSEYGHFLFLDWNAGNFIDVIDLPDYLQGRTFEIIEKTDNAELLTKLATGKLAVKIGNVISNARLILKF